MTDTSERTHTTFQALIDEENTRTGDARSRLGRVVPLALHGLALLNTSVASIGPSQGLLAAFMFAIQKCAGLAYLSYVRGHTAQGEFNCRQAIEYTALLAYLSACPDVEVLKNADSAHPEFVDRQTLGKKAYTWLSTAEPELNELLVSFKRDINGSTAHAGAYTTHFTVDPATWSEDAAIFGGSFFDRLTPNEARTYLLSFCRLIVLMLETIRRANDEHGLITFHDRSASRIHDYAGAVDQYRALLGLAMRNGQDDSALR